MNQPSFESWITLRPGYPYMVSSHGHIYSNGFYVKGPKGTRYTGERLLKPDVRNGYLSVRLNISGKFKWYAIHRLVSECFLPNSLGLPCVNHKDTNKTNNYFGNLEWCTYSYNIQHAHNLGLIRRAKPWLGRSGAKHFASTPVGQYDLNGNLIQVFESMSSVKDFGFSQSSVSLVCNKKVNTHKGFKFQFLNRFEFKATHNLNPK